MDYANFIGYIYIVINEEPIQNISAIAPSCRHFSL